MLRTNDVLCPDTRNSPPKSHQPAQRRGQPAPALLAAAAVCSLWLGCAAEPGDDPYVCEGGRCDAWGNDDSSTATCEDGRPRDPYEGRYDQRPWFATSLPNADDGQGSAHEVIGALGDQNDRDWVRVQVDDTLFGRMSPWVVLHTEPGDVDPSNLEVCVAFQRAGAVGDWVDLLYGDGCAVGYGALADYNSGTDDGVPVCCNQDFSYEGLTTADVALDVSEAGTMFIGVSFYNRTDLPLSDVQGVCGTTYRIEYGF